MLRKVECVENLDEERDRRKKLVRMRISFHDEVFGGGFDCLNLKRKTGGLFLGLWARRLMAGLWGSYGGGNHRYRSIYAFDLKMLRALWGIFIFLFITRTRVALECGKASHFKSVGTMLTRRRGGRGGRSRGEFSPKD